MTALVSLISDYGFPVVAGAALVYVLLRSEIRIHYPGRIGKRADRRHNGSGADATQP